MDFNGLFRAAEKLLPLRVEPHPHRTHAAHPVLGIVGVGVEDVEKGERTAAGSQIGPGTKTDVAAALLDKLPDRLATIGLQGAFWMGRVAARHDEHVVVPQPFTHHFRRFHLLPGDVGHLAQTAHQPLTAGPAGACIGVERDANWFVRLRGRAGALAAQGQQQGGEEGEGVFDRSVHGGMSSRDRMGKLATLLVIPPILVLPDTVSKYLRFPAPPHAVRRFAQFRHTTESGTAISEFKAPGSRQK